MLCLCAATLAGPVASGQTTVPLTDLSFFRSPGKTWQVAGNVSTGLKQANSLNTNSGTGILVNLPTASDHGADLYTNLEHGDADIEFDYMMAPGANSGVYLQGRYEIQLLDSWGVVNPKAGDNGGIYERWDESKPEGQKGYQGHAPRQNASKAPGLWQHLSISFQAPRFDAQGRKVENAKILRAELNGVTIHEDVELTGVTRGAMSAQEAPTGPLRLQGDHGAVAFRNMKITNYDKPRPEISNLRYTVYKGRFDKEPNFANLPPEAEGSSVILTSDLKTPDNEFLIRYTGNLQVKESGEYTFNLNVPGGGGLLRINKQVVIPISEWRGTGKINLPAGEYPFELLYNKTVDWAKPGLGLAVAGPGIRQYLISGGVAGDSNPVDPILVDAPTTNVLRSFMDLPGKYRVVHAVNVGSPEKVHYTYDMDFGTLVQVWRGGFLDATPMWHDRGDGSSRPRGAVVHLTGKPQLTISRLSSTQQAWATDTAGSGFRPKGYKIDEQGRPTFRYSVYGANVSDELRVLENGHGIKRTISAETPQSNLYVRLAEGSTIEPLQDGLYLVDGKSYYVQVEDAGGAQPQVRMQNGRSELIAPLQSKISYTLLF